MSIEEIGSCDKVFMDAIQSTFKVFIINKMEVGLKKIPTVSSETAQLIQAQGIAYPEFPSCSYCKQVDNFQTVFKKLEMIKEGQIKDRLLGLLKTALSAALLAAGIFTLIVTTTEAGAYLGLGLCFSFVLCNFLYAYSFEEEKKSLARLDIPKFSQTGLLESHAITGLFIPIYQAFTRISRLETLAAKLEEKLTKEKPEVQKFLSESFKIYQTHGEFLRKRFEEAIQDRQFYRARLEAIHSDTKAIEKELVIFEEGQKELQKMRDFYKGFAQESHFIPLLDRLTG